MILYHGTNILFDKIDLSKCRPNRDFGSGFYLKYDIVVGPVANDSVAFQLERYIQGLIEIEALVKELTYKKLNIQYYFGTQESINLLKEI